MTDSTYEAAFQSDVLQADLPELTAMLTHFQGWWDGSCATFFAGLYETSGLDKRTVELIMVAQMALRGWETGIRAHAKLALDAGCTPAEIRGAILITLGTGGVASAARGMSWVESLLQHHLPDEP